MNNQNKTKIRVCFVSPKAYPIFNPDIESVFGGAEVDLYMIATELAKDDSYDVSFIVADYGQPAEEMRENVRILKSLDFKQNSLTGALKIWKAMKVADADWYMLETASPGVPLAAAYCRIHHCKLLYRTAHQRECDGTYLKKHLFLGKLFAMSIRKADILITQNVCDQKNLLKFMNVNSQVIPNGHRIPLMDNVTKDMILWAGRSADFKHPERFLELAKIYPDEHFVMICQRATDDTQYENLKAAASKIENLTFIGYVPFHEIDYYYMRAKVFVSTSDSEGFPNTFIQACKASTAILSLTVNPDNFINKYQCGLVCDTDRKKLVENLHFMLTDKKYLSFGENGREYAIARHNIIKITDTYKQLFCCASPGELKGDITEP